jgi:chloramphenicol 3-O-phosphotransferase
MDCVFLNGTVGVGKSTVADAISAIEPGPHAVVDLDQLRRLHPAPRADVFNHELELRNLLALAANYREAGARRFILAGVIEEPAEVPRYVEALAAEGMLVCRLVAEPAVVERRLRSRHADDPEGLEWHLHRAGELAGILEAAALDVVVVDTTVAAPQEVARRVREAAGWDDPPRRGGE